MDRLEKTIIEVAIVFVLIIGLNLADYGLTIKLMGEHRARELNPLACYLGTPMSFNFMILKVWLVPGMMAGGIVYDVNKHKGERLLKVLRAYQKGQLIVLGIFTFVVLNNALGGVFMRIILQSLNVNLAGVGC